MRGKGTLLDGLRRVLHQFAQRVDGRVAESTSMRRVDESKGGALPAGHLGRDRGEDVIVEFDDAGFDLLLVRRASSPPSRALLVSNMFNAGGCSTSSGSMMIELVGELVGEQRQALESSAASRPGCR